MTEVGVRAADRFSTKLDPFGIVSACWQVQEAWWRRPLELGHRYNKLLIDLSELQQLVVRRCCGMPARDPAPAVSFDERFQEAAWTEHPYFDLLKESYLMQTRWIEDTIEATPDVDAKTRTKALFWMRQFLNACSPSNFLLTNPHALSQWWSSMGAAGYSGLRNLMEDALQSDVSMVDRAPFEVGKNLATTPGQVVFRNELLELIQYAPTTPQVHATPIVIVAPWINKYYILDLNPQKSLVNFLVGRGYTVFITSWKNPDAGMRRTSMDDYMLKGALAAVNVAREITGQPQVHAVGYCIGGTILSALMAWLNADSRSPADFPVAHWTLLTTLVDFTAPGDISVLIDEQSLEYLDAKMAEQGYLDGSDMGWSFRMIRSNSLIWHYVVHNYLYGEEPPPFDVLYWNTDTTRLPQAMHSFYLREFYMNNKLARADALTMGGRSIDLRRIGQPLYAVGTEQDHIAPWKETFKICELLNGPVRYVLATSGHILGVVSPPVTPPKRRYWANDATGHIDPEAWRANLDKKVGSWWEDWDQWLSKRCGDRIAAPAMGRNGSSFGPAPGTYVREV